MVDFTRKHRETTHSRHDDDDDDWVEYTDEFGRSRKCHREELPLNEARVALHSRTIKGEDESTRGTTSSAVIEPPSAITVHHVAEEGEKLCWSCRSLSDALCLQIAEFMAFRMCVSRPMKRDDKSR